MEIGTEAVQAIDRQAQTPNQETCLKECGVEKHWIHCCMDLRQLGDGDLLMSVSKMKIGMKRFTYLCQGESEHLGPKKASEVQSYSVLKMAQTQH